MPATRSLRLSTANPDMLRADFCPCEDEMPDPCPACGATVKGDDPYRGVCQARFRGRPPSDHLAARLRLASDLEDLAYDFATGKTDGSALVEYVQKRLAAI